MTEKPEEEPKLIIDEDWKTQVEREKAEAKLKQAAGSGEQATESVSVEDSEPGEAQQSGPSDIPPPPPASFSFLVASLATQAMAALGAIPGDDGQPMEINLDYAKHFIDLLGVLEEKTKGNLTDEEKKSLGDALHQMRMLFVSVSQQQKKQ